MCGLLLFFVVFFFVVFWGGVVFVCGFVFGGLFFSPRIQRHIPSSREAVSLSPGGVTTQNHSIARSEFNIAANQVIARSELEVHRGIYKE